MMKSPMTLSHHRPRIHFRRMAILALAALAVMLALVAGSGVDRADAQSALPEIPGLTVTSDAPGSLTIRWTVANNIFGPSSVVIMHYKSGEQEYDSAPLGGARGDFTFNNVDDPRFTRSGLTAFTEYTVRVRAQAPGAATGVYAAESEVTVVAGPEVTGFTVTSNAAGDGLEVGWTPYTLAAEHGSYIEWKSGEQDYALSRAAWVDHDAAGGGDGHTISDLTPATQYTVRVKVWKEASPQVPQGTEVGRSEVTVTTAEHAVEPPTATSVLSATMTVGQDFVLADEFGYFKSIMQGSMSPGTFSHGGASFTVERFGYIPSTGELSATFTWTGTPTFASAYALCLDGTLAVTGTGSEIFGTSGGFASNSITDPSWEVGDTVDVKLYEGSTCGSTTTEPPTGPTGPTGPTRQGGGGGSPFQYLDDDCEATFLAADGTFNGRWSDDPDCKAAYSSRNVSRFYWFTLPEGQSEVTFTLEGGGSRSRMWLWPEWTTGHAAVGDAGEPMRARFLRPGVHYLEVDSGRSDGRGEFKITMDGIGAGAPGLSCSDTLWTFTGSGSVQGRWDAGCGSSHYHREYNLVLDEPRIVTLDVTSPDADPILAVSTGNPLRTVASNDDYQGSNRRSRISRVLPAGTHHIDVDSKGTASAGSFTLNITFEPSVSCAETYRTITADAAIEGKWGPLCEYAPGAHERYYDLVVAQRREVTLTLDSNEADPLLVLSRIGYTGGTASLTELESNDDFGGSTTQSQIVRTLDPGRYRISARAKNAGDTGGFTLTVAGLSASPLSMSSCADTFQSFTADHTITGVWGPGCDRDRTADEQPYYVRSYDLVVERKETITLVLTSDDADPLLRLYDGGGAARTLLASNDDDGSTSRSRIVRKFEPGRYRIEAATKNPETAGSFTLAVTEGHKIFGTWESATDYQKYSVNVSGLVEIVLESPEGPENYSTDLHFNMSNGKTETSAKGDSRGLRSDRDANMIINGVPDGPHTVDARLSPMQVNEVRNLEPIADRNFTYPIHFVLTVYEGYYRQFRSGGGQVPDGQRGAGGVSGPTGPDTAPTVTDTSQFKTHYFLVGQSVSLTLPAADADSGNGGPYDYNLWHKGEGKNFADEAINGLSFDPLTRTLTGTPEAEGEWPLSYVVHDGDGNRNAATDAFRERDNLKIVVEPDGQAVGGSPPQQFQSEPANQAPSFDATIVTTLELAENSPAGTNVGAPITATDPDEGDTLTYSLSGDDAASFAIDAATGQITTVAGVTYDYEVRSYLVEPSYSLTVTADDGRGGQISTPVTVSLTDVDDAPAENLPPEFHEGESTTREVAENSPAGTKVGVPVTAYDLNGDALSYIALDGAGGAAFALDADTGQLTTVDGVTYDYETKSSYQFMLIVMETDTAEGYLSGISVTVNLTDVDETQAEGDSGPQESQSEPANQAPSFGANVETTLSVEENSAAGTNVGSPITATDPDGGDTLSYSLSGTDAASFAIDSATGQITTKTGVAYDYETDSSYSLAVDVSDGNGGTASTPVTVNLTDVNEDPAFAGSSATREVAENSAAGTNVGSPITATDPDAGDTLTYSLSGTDAASFAIGSSTGQITTKTGVTYDYEAKASYSLTVAASDGNGGTASIAVTVNLTDVAEATPVTACTTSVGTLAATALYAGAWDDADCKAHHQDSRARYFSFTLSADATVDISLSAGALYVSKDTPNNGWGTVPGPGYDHRREVRRNNGKLVHDGPYSATADNDGNTVTLNLVAGETYTVEAASDTGGTFTVSIAPQ